MPQGKKEQPTQPELIPDKTGKPPEQKPAKPAPVKKKEEEQPQPAESEFELDEYGHPVKKKQYWE